MSEFRAFRLGRGVFKSNRLNAALSVPSCVRCNFIVNRSNVEGWNIVHSRNILHRDDGSVAQVRHLGVGQGVVELERNHCRGGTFQ